MPGILLVKKMLRIKFEVESFKYFINSKLFYQKV